MDPNTPMVLAAGRYNDRESAVQDFRDIWREKHKGEFDHIAAAVVTKNEQGELQVERHDSSGKHVAWGGALVGAALVVIATSIGRSVEATRDGKHSFVEHASMWCRGYGKERVGFSARERGGNVIPYHRTLGGPC